MLVAENIMKAYGSQPILRGVSLSVAAGETLALTGESGSGKSTLIHILGGLDRPDAGRTIINGKDTSTMDEASRAAIRRNEIGVVFQQFNLIPSLTASANLSFQARLSGRFDRTWMEELADRLGLGDHMGKYPEELSGGQQQRVAIGRALCAKPGILLADEPTGNLDEGSGDTILELFLELATETGACLVMATHSQKRAAALGRIAHLSHGQLT